MLLLLSLSSCLLFLSLLLLTVVVSLVRQTDRQTETDRQTDGRTDGQTWILIVAVHSTYGFELGAVEIGV